MQLHSDTLHKIAVFEAENRRQNFRFPASIRDRRSDQETALPLEHAADLSRARTPRGISPISKVLSRDSRLKHRGCLGRQTKVQAIQNARIKRICHVAIAVRDQECQADFYISMGGLQPVERAS
jgi:hypothetical protein